MIPTKIEGKTPQLCSSKSAIVEPVIYITAPTDGSIPPMRRRKVMPIATIPTSAAEETIFSKFFTEKKFSLNKLKPMKITINKRIEMFLRTKRNKRWFGFLPLI